MKQLGWFPFRDARGGLRRLLPRSADRTSERARRASAKYIETLLQTSDLLARFDSVAGVLPPLLTTLKRVLPVDAIVVVEAQPEPEASLLVQSVGAHASEEDRDRLEGRATATIAYFLGTGDRLESDAPRGLELTFPLVCDGSVIAGMTLARAAALTESDVAFADAVAGQLAAAIGRHRARDQIARAGAAALARATSAQEATMVALEHARFLVQALAILDEQDANAALPKVARLAMHRLGGCIFEMAEGGVFQHVRATHLADDEVARLVERLVPRVRVIDQALVAARSVASMASLDPAMWRIDSEAEAVRRELDAEWLACLPMRAENRDWLGAAVLTSAKGAPLDAPTLERFTRMIRASVERTRAQRALACASTNKDQVLANVAHDLRGPLNVILLNAAALLGRIPAGTDDRRRTGRTEIEAIKRAVGRTTRLTGDLVDYASIDAGKLRLQRGRVLLGELVTELCDALRGGDASRHVSLHCDVGALPAVWADSDRIAQVLFNLIGNAMKFTPDGGVITIAGRAVGLAVEVSVNNPGEGIPADAIAFVFDRYWQAKAKATASMGVGLGLAITKALVEAHGGKIRVESTRAAGTTFTVTLPVAP